MWAYIRDSSSSAPTGDGGRADVGIGPYGGGGPGDPAPTGGAAEGPFANHAVGAAFRRPRTPL